MRALVFAIFCAAIIAAVVAGHRMSADRAPDPTPDSVATSEVAYLRAVHWFGDAWPINFWRTNLEAHARSDFEKIRADGFNAVVLLVPWPGFAPDARSGELDPVLVERLRGVMRIAADVGLDTILRISYAYEGLDEEHGWRGYHLWLNDEYYQGWLRYIEGLWAAVGSEPGFKFAFFSWEDLWGVMYHIGWRSREERIHAARTSGFSQWLSENYSLAQVSERFGSDFSSWDQISIPTDREPAFEFFLEYLNHAWIERFFLPAQQRFPKLSMEIRIDADPVRDGEEILRWYHHHAAWDLPGADWVTLYWSPAMGGNNQGESLSPETAAERLEWWLEQVSENIGPRQIFISQFLAEDFTPGFEHNGRIPRDQVPEFLDMAGGILGRLTAGYGLWTWKDYGHNAIANPEFLAGLERWQTSDTVEITPEGLRLPASEWISTRVFTPQEHTLEDLGSAELCVAGRAVSGERSRMDVHDRRNDVQLGMIELASETVTRCLEIEARESIDLTLTAHDDSFLNRVELVDFIQKSGMRERDGTLKPVGEAYRELNSELVHRPLVSRSGYRDGWMSRHLVVHLDPPEDAGSLRVATHLPENWPLQPQLTISVAGEIVQRAPCAPEQELLIPLDAMSGEAGPVRVSIEASDVHTPDGDSRPLGCLIHELELTP